MVAALGGVWAAVRLWTASVGRSTANELQFDEEPPDAVQVLGLNRIA
jgi:hypothetical protein